MNVVHIVVCLHKVSEITNSVAIVAAAAANNVLRVSEYIDFDQRIECANRHRPSKWLLATHATKRRFVSRGHPFMPSNRGKRISMDGAGLPSGWCVFVIWCLCFCGIWACWQSAGICLPTIFFRAGSCPNLLFRHSKSDNIWGSSHTYFVSSSHSVCIFFSRPRNSVQSMWWVRFAHESTHWVQLVFLNNSRFRWVFSQRSRDIEPILQIHFGQRMLFYYVSTYIGCTDIGILKMFKCPLISVRGVRLLRTYQS